MGNGGTSTSQIINVLRNNPHFIGVFPSDKLPNPETVKPDSSAIFNYSDTKEPGTHWVAIIHMNCFRTENGGREPEYFDSFGFRPDDLDGIIERKTHFEPYLRKLSRHAGFNGNYITSHIEIQTTLSDKCGPFAVYAVQTQTIPTKPNGKVNIPWKPIYKLLGNPKALDAYIQKITGLYTL